MNRASLSTPVILGMISPPFSTYTMSPMCKSRLSMMSALCRDALLTMVPESCTGSRLATGVMAPVLPTWYEMVLSRVQARSARNL